MQREKKKLGSCFTGGIVQTCEEGPNYGARMKTLLCRVRL